MRENESDGEDKISRESNCGTASRITPCLHTSKLSIKNEREYKDKDIKQNFNREQNLLIYNEYI